jgi:hypothetical protein
MVGWAQLLRTALGIVFVLPLLFVPPVRASGPEPLKLLITIEQQQITLPFPARVTLHLHNSGQTPLWLYRHARDRSTASVTEARRLELAEGGASPTKGGSILGIRLEAAEARNAATPAEGRVLESVGLQHPKLVKLAPGEDYEEKAVVHLSPALAGGDDGAKPVWGRYRLTAAYSATFSNAEEIARNLGLVVWQGEVTSNTIEIELAPPKGQALAAGATVNADFRPISGALVSLSDNEERLIDQTLSDTQGRFSFTELPPGLYWVTARRAASEVDTAVFRHVELTTAEAASAVSLPLAPPEVYQPKQMLHKPVLLRVTDSAGRPAENVALEITWSSGTVLDNVKAQVDADGVAAVALIPGRNYVSVKRHGCPKEEQWIEVAPGDGIDDSKLTLECARK